MLSRTSPLITIYCSAWMYCERSIKTNCVSPCDKLNKYALISKPAIEVAKELHLPFCHLGPSYLSVEKRQGIQKKCC